MTTIDLTTMDLTSLTAVELRKLGGQVGIKGASKGKRAELLASIGEIQTAQRAEKESVKTAPAAPKKGICEDCGRKVGKSGHPTLCTPCWDYAGWENTHSDSNHDADPNAEDAKDCPVCHPELDPRNAPKPGRSRAGMVIIAKGSEVHKSETFRKAAEAAGWSVKVLGTVNVAEDGEEQERFVAIANKGEDTMELAWNGRAYDYPSSGATINGKGRKIRNLKEALRVL